METKELKSEWISQEPKIMRDCVNESFDNGTWEGTRNRFAFLISLELKRLGYSKEEALHELIEWNKKNDPPLKLGSELERKLKPPLNKAYEEGIKFLSCRKGGRLRKSRFCLLDAKEIETCQFLEREKELLKLKRDYKHDETKYERYDWENYLMKKYLTIGNYANQFYKELRRIEVEREYPQGQTILVGFRFIRSKIMLRDRDYHPTPKQLLLASRILEKEGLIRKVAQGKRGTTIRHANGYQRTLPIPRPPKKKEQTPPPYIYV